MLDCGTIMESRLDCGQFVPVNGIFVVFEIDKKRVKAIIALQLTADYFIPGRSDAHSI